jgi:hypothetical protein
MFAAPRNRDAGIRCCVAYQLRTRLHGVSQSLSARKRDFADFASWSARNCPAVLHSGAIWVFRDSARPGKEKRIHWIETRSCHSFIERAGGKEGRT